MRGGGEKGREGGREGGKEITKTHVINRVLGAKGGWLHPFFLLTPTLSTCCVSTVCV